MRYIILVSGWLGSGKDTLANYLVKTRNYKKFAIANELKNLVAKKYELDIELFHTQDGKKTIINQNGETIRHLLIKEAINMKKTYSEDIFIENLVNNIHISDSNNNDNSNNNIVVSDFRYPNELWHLQNIVNSFVQKTTIITIRVVRFDVPQLNCQSENQLDRFYFNHYVNNINGLDKFYKNIEIILKNYNI